jgi:hypothetical protein
MSECSAMSLERARRLRFRSWRPSKLGARSVNAYEWHANPWLDREGSTSAPTACGLLPMSSGRQACANRHACRSAAVCAGGCSNGGKRNLMVRTASKLWHQKSGAALIEAGRPDRRATGRPAAPLLRNDA